MIVMVLGMHRSGTSMVAHMLQEIGIHMGDRLLKGQGGNPAGHFEDLDFLKLNKEILKAAGGAWDRVPEKLAVDRVLAGGMYGEMREIIVKHSRAAFDAGRDWGWKDPRTSILAPWWFDQLIWCNVTDVRIVFPVRRQSEITVSLVRRNGGKKRDWARLTAQYIAAIEGFLKETRLPVYMVPYHITTNRKRGMAVAVGLARFCGRGKAEAERAFEVVNLK